MLCSCDSSHEEAPTPVQIFRISVDSQWKTDGYQSWVFIADEEGVSSEAYAVANDTTITIELPPSYKPDEHLSFNLFGFWQNDDKGLERDYSMVTFTNVKPGDYNLIYFFPESTDGKESTYRLSIGNVPDMPSHSFGVFGKNVRGLLTNYYAGAIEFQTWFTGEKTDITCYDAAFGECRYVTVKDAPPGQSTAVNYEDMIPMENAITYHLAKPAMIDVTTYGVDNHDFAHSTKLTSMKTSSPADELKFYYPQDRFDDHETHIIVVDPETRVSKSYAKIGQVPTSFKLWTGVVTQPKVDGRNLTTSMTTPASLLQTISSSEKRDEAGHVKCRWAVNQPGNTESTIKLPILPASLASLNPGWSKQDLKFDEIYVIEMGGPAAYDKFVRSQLQLESREDPGQWTFFSDGEFSTHFQSSDPAAIGGRTRYKDLSDFANPRALLHQVGDRNSSK